MHNFICTAKDLEYHGQTFVLCTGPPNIPCDDLKPRSHCPGFQSRRRYVVGTWANQEHSVATSASTALNRDTQCWTGEHRPGSGPGGFNYFLKQLGRTGMRIKPWLKITANIVVKYNVLHNQWLYFK